jgi:hypothetical protein
MTHQELITFINEIEDRFHPENWMYRGLDYWPVMRTSLAVDLFFLGRDVDAGKVERKSKLSFIRQSISNIDATLKARAADRPHAAQWKSPFDYLVITQSSHRTNLAGVKYDRICQPLIDAIEALGKSTLTIETLGSSTQYQVPKSDPALYIQPVVEFVRWFAFMTSKLVPGTQMAKELSGLYAYLDEKGCGSVRMRSMRYLLFQLEMIRILSALFAVQLQNWRPRAVMIAEYYNIVSFAMTFACRRAGIPVVEIQHGVQGTYHAAYGSWKHVPENGYNVVPNVFLSWSDLERNAIEQWAGEAFRHPACFTTGNLWLNGWKSNAYGPTDSWMREIRSVRDGSGRPNLAVFTSTLIEDYSDVVLEAIARTADDTTWWIRVHPSYMSDLQQIDSIVSSSGLRNAYVDRTLSIPLPVLLSAADVNVTSFSTTTIEAATVGTPTVLTHPLAEKLFESEIQSGIARTAYATEDIVRALHLCVDGAQKNNQAATPSNIEVVADLLHFIDSVKEMANDDGE